MVHWRPNQAESGGGGEGEGARTMMGTVGGLKEEEEATRWRRRCCQSIYVACRLTDAAGRQWTMRRTGKIHIKARKSEKVVQKNKTFNNGRTVSPERK
jgi:hypothetical protein